MEVSSADVERIPAENIRVSRAEFAAVWVAVERRQEELAQRDVADWYVAGVVVTCRWLAGVTVRPVNGRGYVARAPVTRTSRRAHAELVQAEAVAAEVLDLRRPVPQWLVNQPGWLAGILATLNWVWWRQSGPPIDVGPSAAG